MSNPTLRFASLKWLVACGLSLLSLPLFAAEILLCHEHADVRPWRTMEGTGMHFELINRAAKAVGLTVRYDPLPWKRCLASTRAGQVDGAIGASYLPERKEFAVYPGGDTLDISKRLNLDRYVLVKPKGSPVQWNGKSFSGIHNKVGIPLGYSIGKFLTQAGLTLDDASLSVVDLTQKLAAGRVDAAAVLVGEINTVFQHHPQLKQQLEVLPIPLEEKPYFVIFSKTFYEQHRATAEAFWQAVEKVRNSAEYKALERQALRSMAP